MFVLSSLREGLPCSILEAMACGLPVVSTKTGGIDEVLIDRKTGIMVQSGNVSELKNAMEEMIAGNELRKELGRNGRQFIVENYSNRIVAQKLYNFFKRVYESK